MVQRTGAFSETRGGAYGIRDKSFCAFNRGLEIRSTGEFGRNCSGAGAAGSVCISAFDARLGESAAVFRCEEQVGGSGAGEMSSFY